MYAGIFLGNCWFYGWLIQCLDILQAQSLVIIVSEIYYNQKWTNAEYFSGAQLSKSGMSSKMDWHSQTNIISMVWNGVESFAETKTNDWSETNWKIVPHASRWANCMAKSAREWIFENWALIYIYTILWAVKGRLHCSSPPTRPNGGPPRGPPIVFFHCPEWPWSDSFYYGKVLKGKKYQLQLLIDHLSREFFYTFGNVYLFCFWQN